MKEKIVLQLKAYLLTLGVKNLSKERMDAIADKLTKKFPDLKEEEIDAKLIDYNDLNPLEEIAKQDDKIRTLEAKSKPKPTDKPSDKPEDKPADQEDPTAKMLRELSEKVNALESEKSKDKVLTAFQKKMQDLKTKIPATFYKGRIPEKEEDINALVAEIETDFTEFNQEITNEDLGKTKKPLGSTGSLKDKASDKEVESVVNNII